MTLSQKLDVALKLYYSARELKAAALRSQNPAWTEEKIWHMVAFVRRFAEKPAP